MKISISWLDEWVEVADLDPKQLAHRLTMAGLEVDGIEYRGWGHDDIVIGEIAAIEEHPDADRLVVCRVRVDDSEALHTIVCGATNMKAGDRVPVALPGARPPGVDFAITAREVMGVKSQGMLCSAEELELAGDSQGLMILDAEAPIGEPVFDALELKDEILEIDLTPNRADCLSHLGVAREVSALYGRPLRANVEGEAFDAQGDPIDEIASLTVDDAQGCPQYRMAVLEDIEVSPSPTWLKQRLANVGIRSVNSVVDVTNFVLMDVGQPLHAFDLDRLTDSKIVVRRAQKGESLVGIDHEEYELSPDDLVIADGEKPVALAGVMGGADSEVSEETSRILVECACFDPTTVRRSAKRHGLHTESSHRFERGIDPGGVDAFTQRAQALLARVQREASGSEPTICRGVVAAGEAPKIGPEIRLRPRQVTQLLGVDVDGDDCSAHLKSIGVEVTDREDEETLICRVPTARRDLRRPIDLVEEIARLHGYDAIEADLPPMIGGGIHHRKAEADEQTIVSREERQRLDWMRNALLNQGLMEAVNYSFMGDADLDRLRLGKDDCRRNAPRVANPLVKSQARMRTTLIPSLLDNIKTNLAQRRHDLAFFEMGRRYFESGEQRTLGMAVSGERQRHWSGAKSWDFYELKGVVQTLATPWDLGASRWVHPEVNEPYLHPGVQAAWMAGDRILGFVGQLHPAIVQEEKIEQSVFVAELDVEALVDSGPRQSVSDPPAKYPAVERDFALLYDVDRPYGQLREAVEALALEEEEFGAIFEGMECFDVYEGEQVPDGRRSLAIKVRYRSDEKTLEESEIESADRQLLSHLEAAVDAKLR